MSKISVIIAGAGCRGTTYGKELLKYKDQIQVVAVAEPRDFYRNQMGDMWNIPEEHRFRDWKEIADFPEKIADAAIISMCDDMHTVPAIAFAKKGYHLLLEKPMAPTAEECEQIVKAVKENKRLLGVCHVLRYTAYAQTIKRLLDSKAIGDLVAIQHMESVVYWHQAHSFVRGNWRNEKLSSFMLLQKSCHDIDLFNYYIGKKCLKVSSFGGLKLFTKENQPEGAAPRCLDCPESVESKCPYSALKIYWRDRAEKGKWDWPVDIATPVATKEALWDALRNGPYGRCVYACDNDVVDHQVVNLEFEDQVTVTFLMTAFTPTKGGRMTRFCGTQGYIEGDGAKIKLYKYLDDSEEEVQVSMSSAGNISDGHGGGDGGIIHDWVEALVNGGEMLSGPDETLASHKIVFAAEKARRTGEVVKL